MDDKQTFGMYVGDPAVTMTAIYMAMKMAEAADKDDARHKPHDWKDVGPNMLFADKYLVMQFMAPSVELHLFVLDSVRNIFVDQGTFMGLKYIERYIRKFEEHYEKV